MSWRRDPRLAYLLVNLCTLFWASNFALGRLLRGDIGPFTLTAARFTVAGLVFTALLLRRPASERVPGRQWPLLLGMGVTGVFGFGSLLYTGLRTTTATNASLINGTGPLVIGILAALTLGERFGRRQALGALISLAGVALVVSGGSLVALTHLRLNTGDLLVLAAVLAWGIYSVLSRVVTRTRSALTATALSTWFGLPLLWPAAALEWRTRPPTLSLTVLLAAIYIGVFASVVAYLAWNEGVRRVGPGKATAFYNMLPVYGTIVGVFFLNEAFGPPQLVGGVLIIGGSLLAVWNDLRRPLPRTAEAAAT
jgi:drug/metabolite transporter (DMT)-like permease